MKILGITVEYNPFHNGHKYHLEESLKATGAEYCIAVMSGNFTQRGEITPLDKWQRSRLAVENGVDLVVELPVIFACNRGELFAKGAIDILTGLGATHISFGSESGNIEELQRLVRDMVSHKAEMDKLRAEVMKDGYSYAKGASLAAEEIFGRDRAALMLEPNNILAIEYLKRIIYHEKHGKTVMPVTVKRRGSGYFEKNREQGFAGATVIRRLISEGRITEAEEYVPANVAEELQCHEDEKESYERIFRMVTAHILRSSSTELSEIYCMGEGLENKLKKEIITAGGYRELVSSMVSRRYTEAAIRRLMVYVMLGIKKGWEEKAAVYGRVLAAGENGRRLLRELKRREMPSIPVITNINKDTESCGYIKETLAYDVLASDMYNAIKERSLYEYSDRVVRPYIK